MASAIRELKLAAIDPDVRVSVLLRRALVAAADLDLADFQAWIEWELKGYPQDLEGLPPYRMLRSRVQVFNPYRGWQPVLFDKKPELEEKFSKTPIIQPISEIEDCGDSDFAVTFDPETAALLRKAIRFNSDVASVVNGVAIRGIADAVRNQILDWTIKLEKAGVAGEDYVFTTTEKDAADTATSINIGHVENIGVLGDVLGQATVSIDQSCPFSDDQLAALRSLVDDVARYREDLRLAAQKDAALGKALEAVSDELAADAPDASKIRGLLASLRNVVEGAAGNVIASGILTQLSRFF